MKLTKLQKATSDHIVDAFTRKEKPVKRYLLADEVGLGKTIISADVIKRLAEKKNNNEPFIVFYICGNERVTAQNKDKFVEECDGVLTKDVRLSMQWEYIDEYRNSGKKIWIVPITPATTFTNRNSSFEQEEWKNQKNFIEKNPDGKFECGKVNLKEYLECKEEKKAKENFVIVRRAIVKYMVEYLLKPDMIILDEFQNYSKLVYGEMEEDCNNLFSKCIGNADYTLLLSATPYEMGIAEIQEMNEKPYRDFTGLDFKAGKDQDSKEKKAENDEEENEFINGNNKLEPNESFNKLVNFIYKTASNNKEIEDKDLTDIDFLYENIFCRSERAMFYERGNKDSEVRTIYCNVNDEIKHTNYTKELYDCYIEAKWKFPQNEIDKYIDLVKESPSIAKFCTRYKSIRGTIGSKEANGKSKGTPRNDMDFYNKFPNVFEENISMESHSGISMVKQLAYSNDRLCQMLWIPPTINKIDEKYQNDDNPFWENKDYTKTLVFGNYRLSTASVAYYFSKKNRNLQSKLCNNKKKINLQNLPDLEINIGKFMPNFDNCVNDNFTNAKSALEEMIKTYLLANIELICSVTGQDDIKKAVDTYANMGDLKSVLDEYVFLVGLNPEASDSKLKELKKQFDNMKMYYDRDSKKFNPTCVICYDKDKNDGNDKIEDEEKLKENYSFQCGFAERFTDDKSDCNAHSKAHQKNLQMLFNSPFYPFIIATTSVAQEGLDFHNYCHQIVHWSIPKTPIAFEQREGRIDRYLSHLVRKRLVKKYCKCENWDCLIRKVEKDICDEKPLFPYWYVEVGQEKEYPYFIRGINVLPNSRESVYFAKLRTALENYNYYLGYDNSDNHQKKTDKSLCPLLHKEVTPMRYAESYTRFLKYCETKLNQPFENLVLEFQQNKLEDKFLKLYQSDQALSSEAYFERLEVETYNIQGKNKKEDTGEDTLWLRLCIMIELLMEILNCRYSKAYSIIIQSETYYWLVQEDFATMYDSPQANLDDIGRELREQGDALGTKITTDSIIKATSSIRDRNLEK